MIGIKNTGVMAGLMAHKFHPKLIEIITHVAEKHGVFITESYRDPLRPGDTHSTDPVRAVDLRTRIYPENVAEHIRDRINELWEYDHTRERYKCAIIHDVGRGVHFHIQVHERTRRRKD